MSVLLAFLRLYWKPLAVLAAILALWGALAYWGHTKYKDGVEAERDRNAATFRKLADLTAAAASAVKARNTHIRELLDASNKAREEGIANAIKSQQETVAGLRDGTLRLRKQWAGCQAAAAVSGDRASVKGSDDSANLRAASAGRIIRVGADADIQVRELQAYVRACEAATAAVEWRPSPN